METGNSDTTPYTQTRDKKKLHFYIELAGNRNRDLGDIVETGVEATWPRRSPSQCILKTTSN